MGWSFAMSPSHDKKACVARLTAPGRYSPGYTALRHSVVGNHLWTLLECPDGRITIALDLMAGGGKQGMGWGYKGVDEESGPYVYDCPLSLLDAASEPVGYAIEWRLRVRAWHAKKRSDKCFAGRVVDYGGHRYRLDNPAGPRKGWAATRLSDGLRFRINAKQLAHATTVNTEIAA